MSTDMTNTEYRKLLMRLTKANRKYKTLLAEAEEEYKRRFGDFPSEVDDDAWIDGFHATDSGLSFSDVIENGELNKRT